MNPCIAAIVVTACLEATVIGVHDGDTLTVRLAGHRETIRLTSIDAPELPPRARCASERGRAMAARDALAGLLPETTSVKLWVNPGRRRDRYGRLLADVATGPIDTGEFLLQRGLARPYRGGKRGGWCR